MLKSLIKLYNNLKQPMEKQQAIDRLSAIEKETAQLRKIIEEADKPKSIIDRVKSVEDAINELGESDFDVKEYRKMQEADLSIQVLSGQRIKIWVKALNEGFVFNWNKDSEYKYYIWFDMRKEVGAGFVASLGTYCSSSSVPTCLVYKSIELAEYSSKQIEKEYYNYIKG